MRGFIRQSVRFGMVGLANTAVGLVAIFGSIFFFNAGPALANAFGYGIGLLVSFVINRTWTFDDKRPSAMLLPYYLLAATLAYLLNLSVVLLGTHYFGLGPYLVQFLGMSVYTLSMFLGCRRFVFQAKLRRDASFKE